MTTYNEMCVLTLNGITFCYDLNSSSSTSPVRVIIATCVYRLIIFIPVYFSLLDTHKLFTHSNIKKSLRFPNFELYQKKKKMLTYQSGEKEKKKKGSRIPLRNG